MEKLIVMTKAKAAVCAAAGMIGAALTAMLGGWDNNLITLIIFMALDYVAGLVTAGVFHASKKTESGTLSSKEGIKGIFRKLFILAFVGVAFRLDLTFGTSYIREFAIYGFLANELLSLMEHSALMGVPWPESIKKALDVLQAKAKQANPEEQITTKKQKITVGRRIK